MYVKSLKTRFRHIDLALLDLICLNIAFFCSYIIRNGNSNPYADFVYREFIVIICLSNMLVVDILNSYSEIENRDCFREFKTLLKQSIVVFLLGIFFLFAFKDAHIFSRLAMVIMACMFFMLDYLFRFLWKMGFKRKSLKNPEKTVLIISDLSIIQSVIQNVELHSDGKASIKGVVLMDDDRQEYRGTYPVLCAVRDVADYVCHNWVDDVLIVINTADRIPKETLEALSETGVIIHIGLQTIGSMLGSKQFVEKYGGYSVLTSCMNEASALNIITKRLMDICGGAVGCILTGILYVFLAPMIKAKSPGPAFFKQKRVGKNGKVFYVYKFRSMYMDAEERKQTLAAANRVNDGMMFKMDFDPRVIGNEIRPDGTKKTGIGDFIRRHSLDEFPQFLNVLKGEMSLVGTRPPTLDEWEKYELHHRARLSIKPGITGMWQVSGRSEITDFEEVVRLDTKYINEWSPGLDIKILLKTIAVVFRKDGAM